MANLYVDLLTTWCERLVSLQVHDTEIPGWTAASSARLQDHARRGTTRSGLCCMLADRTGDPRYQTAAIRFVRLANQHAV
jgi:hypothetical protein